MKDEYEVKQIEYKDTKDLILNVHYAHRMPSISHAFGLFKDNKLVGVCTYGRPPSSTLRAGIAGKENIDIVWELNRLVLKNNVKNEASFFIGKTLKLLPRPSIIVSFADTEQNHEGIIYQATNFTYTGLSAKRTDWKIKGKEHLHGISIADEFRGVENRADAIRKKYGTDFYLKERSRKHRYIKIVGSKVQIKNLTKQLRYKPI